jgi:hypothetical protein
VRNWVNGPKRQTRLVTIVSSGYAGIWGPGNWVAFKMWPQDFPPKWNADDVTCEAFFRERRAKVGGGDTPPEAYEDLLGKLPFRQSRA